MSNEATQELRQRGLPESGMPATLLDSIAGKWRFLSVQLSPGRQVGVLTDGAASSEQLADAVLERAAQHSDLELVLLTRASEEKLAARFGGPLELPRHQVLALVDAGDRFQLNALRELAQRVATVHPSVQVTGEQIAPDDFQALNTGRRPPADLALARRRTPRAPSAGCRRLTAASPPQETQMTDPADPFTAYREAMTTMKAPLLDSPLRPVIRSLTVEAASLHSQVRLHVTLQGTLPVAALLGDETFRSLLAPMLTPENVEQAQVHFEHGDLASLKSTAHVTGVDVGAAALLETVVGEYVGALRFRGEVQAGLHPRVKSTEAEIAASSSLNPQWREPVITAHGAVFLAPGGVRTEIDPPPPGERPPF
ncbi:hypothetical protein V3W47_08205 [Deinococcus sp. YIM 134068]|uniref:hypothetical protein n=1 Tax=Deinococcus lichenicola TaxID=3118910 RepID=UPI002F9392E1